MRPVMSPREGLDEIPTRPLEDVASHQIDPPGRFGLRMSNERYHASLRQKARDDMDVVGEDRHLVHVHLPAKCRFVDRGSHGVDTSAADLPLAETLMPRDKHDTSEC